MRKNTKGFTLVELLVVIGIIAVLISILLPALTKAQFTARVVRCAAQMKQIGQAVVIYSTANKGALPPFFRDFGQATFDMNAGGPVALSYLDYKNGNEGAPYNTWENTKSQIHRLVYMKLIPEKITYCPEAQDTNRKDFNNYSFNPHMANYTVGAATLLQPWWKRLDGYGRLHKFGTFTVGLSATPQPMSQMKGFKRALMTDPIGGTIDATSGAPNYDRVAHLSGKTRTWNVMYADCSVRSALADNRFNRSGGTWGRFLDLSNAVQAIADGDTSIRLGDAATWQNKYNALPLDPKTKH